METPVSQEPDGEKTHARSLKGIVSVILKRNMKTVNNSLKYFFFKTKATGNRIPVVLDDPWT